MPRFVLLYHECPPGFPRPSHWDLMLEDGEVLRTWALTQLPRDWQLLVEQSVSNDDVPKLVAATNAVPAEQLADHRPAYLDFEGLLSGDRGSVTRIESGAYSAGQNTPDRWEFAITGRMIVGLITLSRTLSEGPHWKLTFEAERKSDSPT